MGRHGEGERHAVFTYGTLLFPDIMAAVTGRMFARIPATLEGYARYRVAGEPYPGITPARRARVPGVVYRGIDPASLDRIDDFEGELYNRERVTVVGADGTPLDVETYVVRPDWRDWLADEPWDAEIFAREWYDTYVRACREEYCTGG